MILQAPYQLDRPASCMGEAKTRVDDVDGVSNVLQLLGDSCMQKDCG